MMAEEAVQKKRGRPRKAVAADPKVKQETVAVVLHEKQVNAISMLQSISGLSRSDVVRRLIDCSLGFIEPNETLLHVILDRARLEEDFLALATEQQSEPDGIDELPSGAVLKSITRMRFLGSKLSDKSLELEGLLDLTYLDSKTGDTHVLEYIFEAGVFPGRELELFLVTPNGGE